MIADEPAAHYVVLVALRDLSIATGDVAKAVTATTALAERFDLDAAKLIAEDVRQFAPAAVDERALLRLVRRGVADFGLKPSDAAPLLNAIETRCC